MEELLNWIGFTVVLLTIVVSIIISESWALGHDYVYITKNKAKRLNCIQKWLDGFKKLLQI